MLRTDKPLIRLLTEITAIVLVAAIASLLWNARSLIERTSATPEEKGTGQVTATNGGAEPLPLGLTQVKELFDHHEALFVDGRDGARYEAGHIPGAVSLPLGEATARLRQTMAAAPKTSLIIVYCNGSGCPDSVAVGHLLIQQGYDQVFYYEGGFPEWHDAGYPIVTGRP